MSILIKASGLLAVAGLAHAVLGRRVSAASRHLVWSLAVVGLLVLPAAQLVLPEWSVMRIAPDMAARLASVDVSPIVVERATRPVAAAVESSGLARAAVARSTPAAPTPMAMSWAEMLLLTYAVGVVLLLARLGLAHVAVRRVVRRATAMTDSSWTGLLCECAADLGHSRPVRLLRGLDEAMPMAVGIRRPAIVIPAIADTWSDARRRAVLLHELAHVARRDCLTQLVAGVCCAAYWIHPGVWWASRRLRVEREFACDDLVLAAGTCARDYAGHLLELAYTLRADLAPALAVRMASSRQLEGRMLAALEAERIRSVPVLRTYVAGVAILIALLVPLAAATTALVGPGPSGVAVEDEAVTQARADQPRGAGASLTERPGTWDIRPSSTAGTVHLQLRDGNNSHGFSIELARLEGLSLAQLSGTGAVAFRVRREAGTFAFDGVARDGVGAGTYTFAPDAAFAAALVRRGFERPTAEDERRLALGDVGLALLDELNTQKYPRPSLALLIRLADHGVNLSYVREMGQLGYREGRVEALIDLRDHGVSPEYIRALAAQGLPKLAAEQLVQARDHGVSPEYIQALSQLGHKGLSLKALIDARDHGISPEYIRAMRDLGYAWTPDELRNARDHGVGAEYVRELAGLAYAKLSLDVLIRLRDHGVTPDFIKEFNGLGYDRLTIDELVTLRDHGVSAGQTRAANARARTRLPVDALRALADRGWR